jgi:hypothetical protein
MEIHSSYQVFSTNRRTVMEGMTGAFLQPFFVNMPHMVIGKQVVKLLKEWTGSSDNANTHLLLEAACSCQFY